MTLTVFITAVGFLAAIVILRANQWASYIKDSRCITGLYFGIIWTSSTVLVGIMATVWAAWAFGRSQYVVGAPIALFAVMVILAVCDLLSNIGSFVVSWL
jgi:hypothetical protein